MSGVSKLYTVGLLVGMALGHLVNIVMAVGEPALGLALGA